MHKIWGVEVRKDHCVSRSRGCVSCGHCVGSSNYPKVLIHNQEGCDSSTICQNPEHLVCLDLFSLYKNTRNSLSCRGIGQAQWRRNPSFVCTQWPPQIPEDPIGVASHPGLDSQKQTLRWRRACAGNLEGVGEVRPGKRRRVPQ